MSAASEMLEIPEGRARISPITVEQYHQFPEFNVNGRRTELIRGMVIEKLSKSPLHCRIAKALYDQLFQAVPIGFVVRKDDPLTLADSEPEPDLAVVCGDERDFASRHPSTAALVIEVAITSAAADRSMAAVYAEAGVEEYWIVLPVEQRIEVHRQVADGAYLEQIIVEREVTLECPSIPGVCIRLADLFDAGE
jgi:Uma2 family endonuclease